MVRRSLGNSGLMVSPLGLGLAALGRPGYITLDHAADLQGNYTVEAMQAHTHAILDEAWRLGIRYFDVARSYGRAEHFLGSWLAQRTFEAGDRPVVGSKWGYAYTAEWQVEAAQHEVKDHSRPLLLQQWQESIHLLGPSLNLYQIHSATLESGVLTRQEVLAELANLKQQGTRIGLSLSGPNQKEVLAAALEVTVEGERLFDAVQATWNVLERSCGPMLERARGEGLGVIVKEALANGRLTTRNNDPAFAPQLAVLTRIAQRHNTRVDAVALAAALASPWADVVLSGAATLDQLRSNHGALAITLTESDREELGMLSEAPQLYWQRRSHLAWN